MKKILSVLLVGIMILSLTACGGNGGNSGSSVTLTQICDEDETLSATVTVGYGDEMVLDKSKLDEDSEAQLINEEKNLDVELYLYFDDNYDGYKSDASEEDGYKEVKYSGYEGYMYPCDDYEYEVCLKVADEGDYQVFLFAYVAPYSELIDTETTNIEEIFITVFGFFYVAFLLSHIYLTREFVNGNFFAWLIFLSAYGCDTGAYLIGITLGRHKLIPALSPKKSVEGAIGGIVTAIVLCMLFGIFVESRFTIEYINTPLFCALTGLIGSILSQFGDLSASAMKRYTGIKDFGNLIPGHGGILDRFDSVLFTAPAVYYLMIFLSEIQL